MLRILFVILWSIMWSTCDVILRRPKCNKRTSMISHIIMWWIRHPRCIPLFLFLLLLYLGLHIWAMEYYGNYNNFNCSCLEYRSQAICYTADVGASNYIMTNRCLLLELLSKCNLIFAKIRNSFQYLLFFLWMKSPGHWSPCKLQWLAFKIGCHDNGSINGHRGDMTHSTNLMKRIFSL